MRAHRQVAVCCSLTWGRSQRRERRPPARRRRCGSAGSASGPTAGTRTGCAGSPPPPAQTAAPPGKTVKEACAWRKLKVGVFIIGVSRILLLDAAARSNSWSACEHIETCVVSVLGGVSDCHRCQPCVKVSQAMATTHQACPQLKVKIRSICRAAGRISVLQNSLSEAQTWNLTAEVLACG